MRTAPLLLATLMLVPLAARAEDEDEESDDYRIGGEVGLYRNDTGPGSLTSLVEVIDADLTFFDSLAVVGALPFVQLFLSDGLNTETRFRVGNPYFAAYYQNQGPILRLRIGAGFALPVASVPSGSGAFLPLAAYGAGYAMQGLLSPWLWIPERVPLTIPSVRFDADLGLVSIDVRADLVLLVATNDDFGQDNVEIAVPFEAGFLVHIDFLGFGARFGVSAIPTAEGDNVQVSLSPRIVAALGPVDLEARLTMNLDDPFGFAFDDDGIFGFFLGAHAVF